MMIDGLAMIERDRAEEQTMSRFLIWTARCLSLVLVLSLATPTGRTDEPRVPATAFQQRIGEIQKQTAGDYPQLEALYMHWHSHPELSLQEAETSARLARELKEAGFTVTEKVGGHGVVGVLKNGNGPTLLVRADMDALPIVENTGLAYASKVRARGPDGVEVGVMHACGHDVNMTCLVGTARVLAKRKDRWQGTLVFIGQPAEEIGAGAARMLDDGLFQRFPRPDYCLALHCDARYPHGHVNYRAGQMQANVDSVDVTVRGKGGHGAAPHTTVDPIVLAARIVLDLQTIVSREVNPTDPVVVTVGSIHGGTKHNIIPNEVLLQITVRTTRDDVRKQVLESIERKVKAVCQGAGAPAPIVKVDPGGFTPALFNDPTLTRKTATLFQDVLGADRVTERPMSLGGEDFSRFVRAGVPGFYYFVGSAPPERVAEARREGGRPLALTHSDSYYPVPEPTIKTGVLTMSMAVLSLVGK
jgi:amidohydrolase